METTSGVWSLSVSTALTARIDASDIVQEALTDAAQRMDEYLREHQLPLLGWLRRLAGERVIQTHRYHLFARRRSVSRESLAFEFAMRRPASWCADSSPEIPARATN